MENASIILAERISRATQITENTCMLGDLVDRNNKLAKHVQKFKVRLVVINRTEGIISKYQYKKCHV